jgi:TolB protein
MTRFFFVFFVVMVFFASVTSAQMTAPQPITDTAKKIDTTKKLGFSLRTLSMTPVYVLSMKDNAMIDTSAQFHDAQLLPDSCYYAGEKHLKNIRQLTFGGENAEAYLSPDEKYITFQARGIYSNSCDQIYMMPLTGGHAKRISSGVGRTTCSYFLPSGDKILYSSTLGMYNSACPPEPDMSQGYVWPIYRAYDIYVADTNGKLVSRLTDDTLYYDAESTISPKGDRIVFTSTRSGNIDIFSMKLDGTDVKQLTHEEGYNGGAWYSKDGSEIVYRASRPLGDELTEFRDLLKKGLVKPHQLEIYMMNADGSNQRKVTNLGGASFSPYFMPDGKRIIFSSNYLDPNGRTFDLFIINKDGTGLERITYGGGFNSFPMFTKDGKKLVFCSNRNGTLPHETNIFVADWVE